MKQETLDLLARAEAEGQKMPITWVFTSDMTVIAEVALDAVKLNNAMKSGNKALISTAQESLRVSVDALEELRRRAMALEPIERAAIEDAMKTKP